MPYFAISAITASLINIIIGTFVLLKDRRCLQNRTYSGVSFAVAIWCLGLANMVNSTNSCEAFFWVRFLHIGVFLIPPLYFNFICSLLHIVDYKKSLLISMYIISTCFILFNYGTRLLISDVVPKYSFNYYATAGSVYFLYILYLTGFIIYSIILIMKHYKSFSALRKMQFKYVIVASIVAFIGGSDTFLPMFDLPVMINGIFLLPLFTLMAAYVIVKHRFLDIEIIIRETAIFAGIFGFSIGLFMLAIIAGEQFLKPYIGDNRWIVPALSLLLVTFVIRPIEKIIYNVAGRILFRRKYEYQKTLQDAAEGMSKIRDPKKLLSLIVHIISAKLKLVNTAVFLFESGSASYVLKASRGDMGSSPASLKPENALITWLCEKKKPLGLDDVQKWINNFNQKYMPGVLKSDLAQIRDTMLNQRAALSVPCFFRNELLGVLILGEKKNGDFFSQDDIDLFSALSNEAAIALKNSQLYFEIDRRAFELENLYKREHRLFMHSSVAFAAAIDARDPYTHGHSQRVTNISLVILDFMGAMDEIDKDAFFRHRLQITGVLHDIGKIGVPDDILHKPAQLTPEERKEIEKHPVLGAEIVSHIAGLRNLIGGIKYHHERYDGKGYPEGLKSDEIPLMARIISVADTYDAMTSDRPYRKGLPFLTARDEIQRNASAQFDPYVVAAFLKAFEQGKIE
ncbi:MAG: HD domain-containing protein [Candidatus Omnitrophica bacterium]|nr:HD domain-containing protein [Candidatus Omnitrophota bacterium]